MQEIITKIIIGAAAAWAIYRIFKWFGRRRKSQCGCGACGCGGCDGCARRSACEKKSNRMRSLIINGSPRRNGTIGTMMRVASETLGPDAELVHIGDCRIAPCTACMRCRETGECSLPHDDGHDLADKIRNADLLVIGSPTHWGGMSAPLKNLFDRNVPVFMGESARGIPVAPSEREASPDRRRLHHAIPVQHLDEAKQRHCPRPTRNTPYGRLQDREHRNRRNEKIRNSATPIPRTPEK